MSTASKTTPSTKTNTPPPSPKPNSPHHEEIQSDMIVNATPVSMIKPSGSKKRKSKRSRRESTPIVVEEVVVPSPSTEKSKK
jgi:shikimate 5-dehydrogenase